MKIELSKGQCGSLVDFIEVHLLDVIRSDMDIDNLNWVRNILNAHQEFEKAIKEAKNDEIRD